jgi:hypothetical protein
MRLRFAPEAGDGTGHSTNSGARSFCQTGGMSAESRRFVSIVLPSSRA